MIKSILLVALGVLWFVVAGVIFAEKKDPVDWLLTFFVYMFGFQWVYRYALSKTMYSRMGKSLTPHQKKHEKWRLFYFIVGIILCYISSTL